MAFDFDDGTLETGSDGGRRIKEIDEYAPPLPVLLEVGGYEPCGRCGKAIGSSRSGFYHENTGKCYHERCGYRFSAVFHKRPEETGLTRVKFIPKNSKRA